MTLQSDAALFPNYFGRLVILLVVIAKLVIVPIIVCHQLNSLCLPCAVRASQACLGVIWLRWPSGIAWQHVVIRCTSAQDDQVSNCLISANYSATACDPFCCSLLVMFLYNWPSEEVNLIQISQKMSL